MPPCNEALTKTLPFRQNHTQSQNQCPRDWPQVNSLAALRVQRAYVSGSALVHSLIWEPRFTPQLHLPLPATDVALQQQALSNCKRQCQDHGIASREYILASIRALKAASVQAHLQPITLARALICFALPHSKQGQGVHESRPPTFWPG